MLKRHIENSLKILQDLDKLANNPAGLTPDTDRMMILLSNQIAMMQMLERIEQQQKPIYICSGCLYSSNDKILFDHHDCEEIIERSGK